MKKHLVRDGDTIASIAQQYGVSQNAIVLENNLSDANTLASGIELSIPTVDAAPAGYLRYTSPNTSSASSTANALKLIEKARPDYSASEALLEAERLLAQWQENKPGSFSSTYDEQIASLLSQLQTRPSFAYDPSADPLYELYRQQYARDGYMAMLDASANAAALSGGFANSYAVTASNQAYQNHLAQLGGIMPQLYDRAYDRWQDEGQALADQLSTYRQLQQTDYDRWRDGVEDYYEDLTYYYNRYNDMSKAEYEAYQNDLAAWEADRDYWYQRLMDEQEQANWKAEFDFAVQKAASSGGGGGGGGGGRSSGGGSSSSGKSSNYTTFLNGLKENVRINVNMGRSKSSVYSMINNQVNEFLSNDFITKSEATQMRAVAQSYYQTQYSKKRS